MPNLVGIGLSQVPTNSMLGGLAYQDPEHASIKDLDLKNLSQINSEINDTATDIFVYDTRKDSDGGAWRKRTQHTSWYNETLGTATRGTRKEFPAVAVIVAEQNFIKIYDGDDPDLPMWMVFNTIAGGQSQGMADRPMIQVQNTDKIVYALNGILATGTKNESSNYGQPIINFINEVVLRMDSQGGEGGRWMGNIAQRNEAIGYQSVDYDYVIAASRVNDIAMKVLPNAPIDETTGLPVPTIAVGTDGGASIIKDDGSVVDITITTGTNYDVEHIDFTDDNRVVILWNAGGGEITIDEIPGADTSANYPINLPGSYYNDHSPTSYSPNFLTEGPSLSNRIPAAIQNFRAVGTTAALSVFEENKESEEDGMVAFISSSYNTGYQQGRIRGAFLSDTDTTNAVGTELHPNGNSNFSSTDVSYINNTASGTATVTSNQLVLSGGTAGYSDHIINITTEVGAKYVISIDYVSNSGYNGSIGMYVNSAYLNELNDSSGYIARSTGKTYTWYFTADATNENIDLVTGGAASNTYTFDNWTIKKVEEDRSLNNNGLQVYGTVTKSAVATGAELVGYSPSSNTSYLEQPYNSALDYGTGDMYYSMWVYANSSDSFSGNTYIFERSSISDTNNRRIEARMTTSTRLEIYANGQTLDNNVPVPANSWYKLDILRRSGEASVYINGEYYSSTTGGAATGSLTDTSAKLVIGNRAYFATRQYGFPSNSRIALFRTGATAPSAEQIKKMYEDEKHLFQENAKCTLYGSSDAVTALAYDDSNNVLHVGTSAGRSEFQGLHRINNTTTAVTTAISASNGLVAEQ